MRYALPASVVLSLCACFSAPSTATLKRGTTGSIGAIGGTGSSPSASSGAETGGESATSSSTTGGHGASSGSTSTSRGPASSSATSTSTGSSGACVPGRALDELHPCQSSSDCACPLLCGPGAGETLCEYPCQALGDCPTLYTACVAGTCQPDLCGPGGGQPNGNLDGTCAVVQAEDGSCVPGVLAGVNSGLCYQGGQATSVCDPQATRSNPEAACQAGSYCLGQGDAGGECRALCDPFAASECGQGGTCVAPLADNPRLGVCLATAPSTASSTGSSGSTTGSTSGSGSSTGSTGTDGCSPSVPPGEFQTCQALADCGCPLKCVRDPAAGGQVCEYGCTKTSDCPDLVTICSNGVCTVNGCGVGTRNGTFNSLCSAVGNNDGTCLPLTADAGTASLGYCYQGGSASASCDPSGSRNDLSRVCQPGTMCYGGALNFGGTCTKICDPTLLGGCPMGQFCTNIVNEPDLGICVE